MRAPENIETLIAERAPWLFRQAPHVALLRRALQSLLSYSDTLALADALKDQSATQIMDHMSARLSASLSMTGLEHIPSSGPALIVCNHPTGIADAIMLWTALRTRRSDAYFFANRDIVRVLPQMQGMIAPVEWRPEKRSHTSTRRMLQFTADATQQGRIGVIFPSGRLAYRSGLRLKERPWIASAVTIARKYDLPIIPMHLKGRNSGLFYLLSLIHPTLRDITLFHETLNKADKPFQLHTMPRLDPHSLPKDVLQAVEQLRSICEETPAQPNRRSEKWSIATNRSALTLGARN